MGAEFLFGLATLKIPHMQSALEKAGFQLIGFTSGYDCEEVAPGDVRRVFEGVFCKVLVPEDELMRPDPANLTPSDDHEGFYDPDALRCRNPLLAAVIETERAKWVTKHVAALSPMPVEITGEVEAEVDQQVPSLAKSDE